MLKFIFAHFLTHEIKMPIAGCLPGSQKFVKVIKAEEKDPDVNLATHLLSDGYKGEIDVVLYSGIVEVHNNYELFQNYTCQN